jgi:salicylate hydroxylase
MAIEDAYVLAQCLSRYSIGDALIKYEQVRKPRTTKIQKMSKANAGLYHMHGGALGRMKLKALQTVSRFVPRVIQSKLDAVYGYDATKGFSSLP